MVDLKKAFGLDPEYNKLIEEQSRRLQEQAIQEKRCCTCEYYIPVPADLPGFATAYPECENGGLAIETCSNYRRKGAAIRNSNWANQIRERFMRVV